MLQPSLLLHFPVATRGDRTQCGTQKKPEVKSVDRPPRNMLGDTLDDHEALSGETQSETRF